MCNHPSSRVRSSESQMNIDLQERGSGVWRSQLGLSVFRHSAGARSFGKSAPKLGQDESLGAPAMNVDPPGEEVLATGSKSGPIATPWRPVPAKAPRYLCVGASSAPPSAKHYLTTRCEQRLAIEDPVLTFRSTYVGADVRISANSAAGMKRVAIAGASLPDSGL